MFFLFFVFFSSRVYRWKYLLWSKMVHSRVQQGMRRHYLTCRVRKSKAVCVVLLHMDFSDHVTHNHLPLLDYSPWCPIFIFFHGLTHLHCIKSSPFPFSSTIIIITATTPTTFHPSEGTHARDSNSTNGTSLEGISLLSTLLCSPCWQPINLFLWI